MAIQKTFSTQYGITASYWRIEHFEELDFKKKLCTFIVDGFREEALKQFAPIATRRYTWNGDDFPFTFEGNLYPEAYAKLKTLPEWIDAEDV